MIKLQLAKAEREHFVWNRGLTTDLDGNEILCGLSRAESVEYLDLMKRERPGDSTSRQRFLELHDRYNFARLSVAGAEMEARDAGPKH
jgi:hypothetical protein